MQWVSTDEEYIGQWQDGYQHGYGEHYWHARCVDARALYHDENHYKGQWVRGKRHGKGTFTYATGEIYKGGFQDNKKHGAGLFWYGDGRMHAGEFLHDRMVGPAPPPPSNGKPILFPLLDWRTT